MSTKRHSRLGIASVIIGFLFPLLLFLLVVLMIAFAKFEKGSVIYSLVPYIKTLFWIFAVPAPVFHFVAVLFAAVGWSSKETNNTFPIIGLILNLLMLIIGSFLLVFGFLLFAALNVPVG